MAKRMTIRMVNSLAEQIQSIAEKRGISINALITEMAWDFVEQWNSKMNKTTADNKNN